MAVDSSETPRTRATVEQFYGSMATGDWDTVFGFLHDDIALHEPPSLPYGGVYRGKEAFRDLSIRLAPLVDYASVTTEGLFVDGERALAVSSARTATGEPLSSIQEILLREGKVARIRIFPFDPAPLANAANAAGIR